jgi:hypothetical protein
VNDLCRREGIKPHSYRGRLVRGGGHSPGFSRRHRAVFAGSRRRRMAL